MTVEIFLLSAPRQGTRLVLDGAEFWIGTDAEGGLVFRAPEDPAAKEEIALLRREDDRWSICALSGNALTVNQQKVVGAGPLRSGDVVRLSARGPDFRFHLDTDGAEILPSAAGESPVTWLPVPAVESVEAKASSLGVVTTVAAVVSAPGVAAAPGLAPAVVPATPTPVTESPLDALGGALSSVWGKRVFVVVGVCLLAALLWRLSQPPTMPQIQINIPPSTPPVPQPASPQPPAPQPVPPQLAPKSPPRVAPPTDDRPLAVERAATGLEETVYLLQVEKAGRRWPMASAVAIGKRTLLTSAREALQFGLWREKEGFKVWAVNSPGEIAREIRGIRVHGRFAALADQFNYDFLYFNLALLEVDDDLPKVAPLASREELNELREDAAIRCVGYPHEGKKTPASRKFEPQLVEGCLYPMTVAKNLPENPVLLRIGARLGANVQGSPIFNEQGRVIGVYGDPASAVDPHVLPGAAPNDVHLVSLVAPESIRLWLDERNTRLWLSPADLKMPDESRRDAPGQPNPSRTGGP